MASYNKGNQFWKQRTKHGRNKKFETPEILKAACEEYFDWVEKNPLWETKLFHFQGKVKQVELPKMRAMTIKGLTVFLGISHETWLQYKKRIDPTESGLTYHEVVDEVERIVYEQKFAGASADLFNASIIGRDLGLVDKKEHTGKEGGPIETKDLSDNDLARRIAHTLTKLDDALDDAE